MFRSRLGSRCSRPRHLRRLRHSHRWLATDHRHRQRRCLPRRQADYPAQRRGGRWHPANSSRRLAHQWLATHRQRKRLSQRPAKGNWESDHLAQHHRERLRPANRSCRPEPPLPLRARRPQVCRCQAGHRLATGHRSWKVRREGHIARRAPHGIATSTAIAGDIRAARSAAADDQRHRTSKNRKSIKQSAHEILVASMVVCRPAAIARMASQSTM